MDAKIKSFYGRVAGSGGRIPRIYSTSWVAQTLVVVTHGLATTDLLCQIYGGIAAGWFACLVGAFTNSGGDVIQVVSLNNGPSSFTVPFGATQLQLGVNDGSFFDNLGSWTIAVNGTNHTVLGTAQPWQFTGGINSAFIYGGSGGASDGTAPTVISGLTAGSIVTIAFVSGAISPGGAYSTIYTADGVTGVGGTGGTPPSVDPAYYATNGSAGPPFLLDDAESLTINDGNTLTITFAVPFTGKAVVVG